MAPAPSKKQRTSREGDRMAISQLKKIAEELLSSRAHVNNLPRILSFLSPSSPLEFVLESLLTLQSYFITLIAELHSSPSRAKPLGPEFGGKTVEDPEAVYRVWLRSRFDEFVNSLIELAVSPQTEDSVKDVALEALMEFVKRGKGGKFHSAIYYELIHSLVHSSSSVKPTVDLLVEKYFKFIDVRCFTLSSLAKIAMSSETSVTKGIDKITECDGASESRLESNAQHLFHILSRVPPPDGLCKASSHEMWSQSEADVKETESTVSSGASVDAEPKKQKTAGSPTRFSKKLRGKFTRAWISFLKLPLSLQIYKEVLVVLPQIVIPHVANPVILCDFLTRSYDIGGVISVMALSSLFILITKHGVEYPKYYDKLYALLTPSIFMAKHRARFLQLLDTSLKSSHLPAYVAAAFAKKLSRLTLSTPPSGSLVIIAIIHNLLRRHPSINFLVHQNCSDGDSTNVADEPTHDDSKVDSGPRQSGMELGKDLFNFEELDLVKSNAMRSSLWEVETMRDHYCPAVSRFVASLEADLTMRAKTSEVAVADFSSGSYSSIFRDEIKRRIKQVPVAFYKSTPTGLFLDSDFPGWSFEGDSIKS
ncbi:CCAAT-binding factor isoform X2 [Wolffia australiana]